MPNTKRRLPPLTALPAFEASARHLSFTRAAEELFVSQAAVSRQIRVLEEQLGTKLFQRFHRRIQLTDAGQRFQHAVSVSLDLIESSAAELRGQSGGSDITLGADISMAHLWLLPRFPFFREAHPEIQVSILASERESDCLKDGIDLALLYGNGHWPGYEAHLLVNEEIFPICSPEFLQARPAIERKEDLLREVLLDLKGDRWDWVDWRQWFSEQEVAIPEDVQFIGFNSLPLLVQAACRGQGVGLGWGSLVDHLLDDGSLVRPLEDSIQTGRGYYVIKRADARLPPETQVLYDWILEISEADLEKRLAAVPGVQ